MLGLTLGAASHGRKSNGGHRRVCRDSQHGRYSKPSPTVRMGRIGPVGPHSRRGSPGRRAARSPRTGHHAAVPTTTANTAHHTPISASSASSASRPRRVSRTPRRAGAVGRRLTAGGRVAATRQSANRRLRGPTLPGALAIRTRDNPRDAGKPGTPPPVAAIATSSIEQWFERTYDGVSEQAYGCRDPSARHAAITSYRCLKLSRPTDTVIRQRGRPATRRSHNRGHRHLDR